MISLGDKIKFSLSPSNTKDSLSTNVSGVPLDDRNLVRQHKLLISFSAFFSSSHLFRECYMEILSLQIIKALNLYRKKTGTDKFFWVRCHNAIFF